MKFIEIDRKSLQKSLIFFDFHRFPTDFQWFSISCEMRATSENSGQNPAKHARHSKIPTQTSQIARDILKIRPKTRETRATFENSVQNLAKCARHPNISVKLLQKRCGNQFPKLVSLGFSASVCVRGCVCVLVL